jgi:S-formylglutathione hydrolase FrmB
VAAHAVRGRVNPRGYSNTRGAAVVDYTLDSRILGRRLPEVAVIPPGRRRRPLLVFLHGRHDPSPLQWLVGGSSGPQSVLNDSLFTALARLGDRAPVLVALNGGAHSYFHDRREGRWATEILREAIPDAERRFHTNGHIAIGGISMGGYGALHLASLAPRRFCAVGGHSAALWTSPGATAPGAFDDAADYARNDVFARADAFRGLPVWIDGGARDPFRDANRAFVETLRRAGARVSYHVWPGGHERAYWHARMASYMRFYASALGHCATSPRTAARALVKSLRATTHADTFAASRVVSRNGRLWLAVGTSSYLRDTVRTLVRVYRWSGNEWKIEGRVAGPLGPSQWISAAALTGSRDPDFAIEGCGAGDTNCLSVVSDVGGRWHAVPFEYGYGVTTEVNGVPTGGLVLTAVDACGCAGGPSTWTYERYGTGRFRPVDPPGKPQPCDRASLTSAADPWQVKVLHFDRVACAAGWALALGTGAGFDRRVVGLFDHGGHRVQWQLLTLDNGLALPTAPAIYDVPLSLFVRLAVRLGPSLAPELAAAQLIARLQAELDFGWPLQNGIVRAAGAEWLIAVVPAHHVHDPSAAYPVDALVYRWNGGVWRKQQRVNHLPPAMNLAYFGGWFVARRSGSGAVTFAVAGSDARTTKLLTNAGGRWRVA